MPTPIWQTDHPRQRTPGHVPGVLLIPDTPSWPGKVLGNTWERGVAMLAPSQILEGREIPSWASCGHYATQTPRTANRAAPGDRRSYSGGRGRSEQPPPTPWGVTAAPIYLRGQGGYSRATKTTGPGRTYPGTPRAFRGTFLAPGGM